MTIEKTETPAGWPDTEQLLQRFRGWLDQTQAQAEALGEQAADSNDNDALAPVGVYPLVEQLTALRHDIKLLTKAARGGEERTEATLVAMQAAIEQFHALQGGESQAAEQSAQGLVEALIELDESLARCRRVIDAARTRVLSEAHQELAELRDRLDQLYRAQPRWRRWLCRPWHQATRDIYAGRTLETQRRIFDSLRDGYQLIQERMARALQQNRISRIECVGRPVDPHRMTVIEVVSDLSQAPGTVIEEVRSGYCWRGKVVRFAEVKAAGES